QLAAHRGPGPQPGGRHRRLGQQRLGHRSRALHRLRPGPPGQDGRGSGAPDRRRRGGSRQEARRGWRAAQGEESALRRVRAEPAHGERQGEPARVLRGRVRRLPCAVRSRAAVERGDGGRRAARRRHVPRARPAHGGRVRARRRRAAGEGSAAQAAGVVVKALALLLVLGGVASAADTLGLPPVTRTTLQNGLRVVVAEYRELPLVEAYVMVGAGAAQDPPGKEGVAALTAGALRRGTKRLSAMDLARAIETLGGEIDANAGTDGTIVTAEFLSKDFAEGLDLLRQVLLEPAFAKDEVRRLRDEQGAGIVSALENPTAAAENCYAAFL